MMEYDSMDGRLQGAGHQRYLAIALFVSLLLIVWLQLPRILDPYVIERDYRSLGVFHPGSPLLTSMRTEIELATPLYTGTLLVVGQFMSPALFAKLLAIPLLLVSVYYAYRLGAQIAGAGTALALALGFAVFNLGADTEVSVVAGLQRSFTCPLLLALLYYLHNRRWLVASLIVLLAGLVYLPIILVFSFTYAFSLVRKDQDGRWQLLIAKRYLLPLLVAFFLIVVAVSPAIMPRVVASVRTMLASLREGQHFLKDPVHQPGGRAAMFVIFPIFGRAGIVSSASTAIQFVVLGLLALLVVIVRGRRVQPLPPVFGRLLLASITAFALSWLAILLTSSLLLYLPSRHTEFAFFVLLVFFVFLNLEDTLRDLAQGLRKRRGWVIGVGAVCIILLLSVALLSGGAPASGPWKVLRWLLLALLPVLLILAGLLLRHRGGIRSEPAQRAKGNEGRTWLVLGVAFLLVSPLYIRVTGPTFHKPGAVERELLAYVETLPENALLAGDPCSLDDVPYYARRSVLYSCWRFEEEEALAGLRAYYAETGAEVLDFCRRYGVDYLVVDQATLDPDLVARGGYFFEPYVTMLAPTLKGRTDFALRRVPREDWLFAVGSRFVIACDEATLLTGGAADAGGS